MTIMLPDSLVEEVKREVDISSCLDDCSDRVTHVNDVVTRGGCAYTDTPFSSGLNVLDNASDRWKQDDEILVEPPLSSLTVEPFFLSGHRPQS